MFTGILTFPVGYEYAEDGELWLLVPPCDGVTNLITFGGTNWAELQWHRNTVRQLKIKNTRYLQSTNVGLRKCCIDTQQVLHVVSLWSILPGVTCVLSVYLWCDIVSECHGAQVRSCVTECWHKPREQGTRVMGTSGDSPEPGNWWPGPGLFVSGSVISVTLIWQSK